MSLSEFVNHKFLQGNHIDDIKQGLYLVDDHYAVLIRNAAVAIVSHYYQHGFDDLSSDACVDEAGQVDVLMR